MSTETAITPRPADTVIDNLRGTRDAITVGKVFGEAYEIGDVTIIPVARVYGGGGGGGGEGVDEREQGKGTGSGFGTGFGLHAHPVGVYEVRNGEVNWRPSVDANRIAQRGQMIGALVVVATALVLLRRWR